MKNIMSYAQFGYPYHPAPQILVSSQTSGNPMPPNPCCESGRVVDPVTNQAVFPCQQCDTHSLVYPRLGSSVPTTPYAPYAPEQTYPTVGMGVETPAGFYSPIGTSYVLKEGNSDVAGSWQPMQSAGYYSYDPSIAYGYGYDVNGARRKNATREATATLKAWLNEHRKNPYPTKGEKIMLAIITKMTLTQVSTWFANARRRLKKENKMTWETKGKEDEDDDDDGKVSDDDDDTKDSSAVHDSRNQLPSNNVKIDVGYNDKIADGSKDHLRDGLVGPNCLPLPPSAPMTHNPLGHIQRLTTGPCDPLATTFITNHSLQSHHHHHSMTSLDHMSHRQQQLHQQQQQQQQQQQLPRYPLHSMDLQHEQDRMKMQQHCEMNGEREDMSAHARVPLPSSPSMSQNKPKIWSLADTATCKTPPTASLVPLVQRPNRQIGPPSVVNRPTDGQWPPSTVYQRPITSPYQSGQPTPPCGNNGYGVNVAYHPHPQPQQSPVNVSSVPLALLVHDKNQNASATTNTTTIVNPKHGVILNQAPASGCDVISSSPTSTSAIATTSNNNNSSMRTPVINQCSNNPFNELQTDTPPQTPPNHKFTSNGGAGISGGGSYGPRLGHTTGVHVGPPVTAYNSTDMYGSQRALISRLPDFQDDNSDHQVVVSNFPNGQTVSHVSAMNTNHVSNNDQGIIAGSGNAMEGTAFKPVYKSSVPNNGSLVIA